LEEVAHDTEVPSLEIGVEIRTERKEFVLRTNLVNGPESEEGKQG